MPRLKRAPIIRQYPNEGKHLTISWIVWSRLWLSIDLKACVADKPNSSKRLSVVLTLIPRICVLHIRPFIEDPIKFVKNYCRAYCRCAQDTPIAEITSPSERLSMSLFSNALQTNYNNAITPSQTLNVYVRTSFYFFSYVLSISFFYPNWIPLPLPLVPSRPFSLHYPILLHVPRTQSSQTSQFSISRPPLPPF